MLNCESGISPGAVFDVEGSGSLSIANSTFSFCYSSRDGGTIQAYAGASLVVVNSNFQHSNSAGCGGAIATGGGATNISRCNFKSCSADVGGGAICAFDYVCYGEQNAVSTSLQISGSTFSRCNSSGTAGALWATSTSAQSNVFVGIDSSQFQVTI